MMLSLTISGPVASFHCGCFWWRNNAIKIDAPLREADATVAALLSALVIRTISHLETGYILDPIGSSRILVSHNNIRPACVKRRRVTLMVLRCRTLEHLRCCLFSPTCSSDPGRKYPSDGDKPRVR